MRINGSNPESDGYILPADLFSVRWPALLSYVPFLSAELIWYLKKSQSQDYENDFFSAFGFGKWSTKIEIRAW